jgi:cytochrome P450
MTVTAFQPESLDFIADPYPVYAELRERAPVWYDERTDHWYVARYDDVNRLLRDPRRLGRTYLHRFSHAEMGKPEEPDFLAPFWTTIRNGMLDREQPDHTRLRRLVSQAFTPRRVEALRPTVQRVMDGLLDRVAGAGEFDLLREVAEPLPVTIIAELLGVPEPDRDLLRPWSADICGMYELNPTEEAGRTASRACLEFGDYLRGLAAERRARPRDDLITALTAVDELTEDELVGTCVLLLNAGHEATVNVTGNGWWSLLRNPAALARLRGDPRLVPTAVEELMRYDTPLQMFERWVLDPIEVGGVRIPRGAELGLLFGSANRDPAVFAEPDELRLDRDPNPHLSFGAGIHFCLGAPLARIELEVSFASLLRRLPRLELVAKPRWKPAYIIRGLQALHVRA